MSVCCECCVLSGRGLCDGLITRPEESYQLWHVVVCDQETLKTRRLKPATGLWKIQPQWVVTPGKRTNERWIYIIYLWLIQWHCQFILCNTEWWDDQCNINWMQSGRKGTGSNFMYYQDWEKQWITSVTIIISLSLSLS